MAKLVIILGFALSFAAGLVIGSRSRPPVLAPGSGSPATAPSGPERRGPGGWLSAELGLTSDQRTQLDRIWSEMARNGRSEQDDQRREYRQERDNAISDLVPPARMADYDRIIDTYTERLSDLERASREAYQGAVEKTKQILTPEQRTRYEAMLSRHQWGPGSARDRHGPRRAETRATSQPGPTPVPSSHESLKGAQ